MSFHQNQRIDIDLEEIDNFLEDGNELCHLIWLKNNKKKYDDQQMITNKQVKDHLK